MKPQDIYTQIINVEKCHEYEGSLCMFQGTTVIELPGIPVGSEVVANFNNESGVCQIDSVNSIAENTTLGTFAIKLTLEPITE